MMDDLQQAYSAYQQALYHLSDPKVCLLPRFFLQHTLIAPRNPSYGMG
jgi:hypothetical protein